MKDNKPKRSGSNQEDYGSIAVHNYNEPTAAKKVMIIEPVVVRAVGAGEEVGFGKYVKVTGTTYTLDLVNKVYAPAETYLRGQIISQGTDIYMAMEDNITGTFDATKWKKVADKTVGPIAIEAGATVCTGRWHNTVTAAGFLVDDESVFKMSRN